jgi:hypothetical protein
MRTMNPEELVPLIHATATKAVLFITGGGTEVLPMLLKRGGGSATLLSALVPYANAETAKLLGGVPDKFVSEQTTRQMAMAAYQKALELSEDNAPVIGVACSSALQKTPNERAGRIHYIYAALQTGTKTVSLSVAIDPKVGFELWSAEKIRLWEETANAELVMNLIAEGCGVDGRLFTGYLELKRRESSIHCGYFPELLEGKVKALCYTPGMGVFLPMGKDDYPINLLSGSFNPAHPGHFEMADFVGGRNPNSGGCDFELSIRNVDKPILDFITIEERLATCGDRRVWLANAPTFMEKAKIFPGTTFAVGYDTAMRIVNPKYANIDNVRAAFETYKTRFTIFGRTIDGKFYAGLDKFPKWFSEISSAVTQPLDSAAVSSSSIRGTGK